MFWSKDFWVFFRKNKYSIRSLTSLIAKILEIQMSIYNRYLYKYLAHLLEKNKMNLLIHNEGNMSVFSNPS